MVSHQSSRVFLPMASTSFASTAVDAGTVCAKMRARLAVPVALMPSATTSPLLSSTICSVLCGSSGPSQLGVARQA